MKTTLLILFLALLIPTQSARSRMSDSAELARLRAEFIQATKDYKLNLDKLAASYQKSLDRAQKELEQARSFYAQGMVSINTVEAGEQEVAKQSEKIKEVHQRMASADKQIAETLADAKQIEQQYRKAVTKRASTRQRPCPNWKLTASRRETKRSVTVTYQFICQ